MNNMRNYTDEISAYFKREKRVLDAIDKASLSEVMNILEQARMDDRQIFIMGNGGSAATASHYCCDFNKGISIQSTKKNAIA